MLDEQDGKDPFELYDVLGRIKAILSQNHYDFINLSIGPAVCIEDEDIHPWTAVLDSLLSNGQTLLTIAAGNNGDVPDECDRRVQVPSDCVNALAVGAADSTKAGWGRAPYSAVGPGRAPGLVKPDLLDFGGSPTEPFLVTDVNQLDGVAATQGTSFAAPCLLRRAIGLRATYGEDLSPLVIKALLVHTADPGDQRRAEVGWGRVVPDMDSVMVCGDGEVRVIYQGRLEPGKYLRARIPLPPEELKGKVEIKATAVFATETDPEDPSNYSRAGLDIVFRPHCERFRDDAVDPVSRPFFRKSDFDTEATLRTDAHKWETALNSSDRMFGRSLKRPVFDIHYNARSNGGGATDPESIPYAFVVTVRSHATANLYEQVAAEFNQLRAVNPVTQQVRVQ